MARSSPRPRVSSIGGRTTAPFASLYHAAKFALEGFSESFRYEASLHGVRVKLVEPAHFSRSLRLARHPDYDPNLDNYMHWVHQGRPRGAGASAGR